MKLYKKLKQRKYRYVTVRYFENGKTFEARVGWSWKVEYWDKALGI
jgi:hypothetical protein